MKKISRVLGFLIDVFIFYFVYIVILYIYTLVVGNVDRVNILAILSVLIIFTYFPILSTYSFIMSTLFKATLGKMAFKMRIRGKDKKKINIFQIAFREFVLKGFIYWGPLFIVIDVVYMFVKNGIALHDKLSKTRVTVECQTYTKGIVIFCFSITGLFIVFLLLITKLGEKEYAIRNYYEYSDIFKEDLVDEEKFWNEIEIRDTSLDNEKVVTYETKSGIKVSEQIIMVKHLGIWWQVEDSKIVKSER